MLSLDGRAIPAAKRVRHCLYSFDDFLDGHCKQDLLLRQPSPSFYDYVGEPVWTPRLPLRHTPCFIEMSYPSPSAAFP